MSSNAIGKCNVIYTLDITPEGKKREYIGCLGRGATSFVSGILDSGQISKPPLKKEKSKTFRWFIVKNSKGWLERVTKNSHCTLNYLLTLSITSIIIMSMDISRYRCVRLDLHIYIVTGTLRKLIDFTFAGTLTFTFALPCPLVCLLIILIIRLNYIASVRICVSHPVEVRILVQLGYELMSLVKRKEVWD